MTDTHIRIVSTREGAHAAITQAYAVAKTLLADGKRVQISVGEDSDPITIKQRRFYHGPVLGQISEQVRVAGERYVMDVWKEHLRVLFLPDKWEMRKGLKYDKKVCRLVPAKRATPHRIRSSTENLSIKAYSELLDKVIAHAATEWGVVFTFDRLEREAVRYVRPVRAREAATC